MAEAEDELISRARRGDHQALTTLLQTHGPEVRRRVGSDIGRCWKPHVDLDDVMQISYMEAFLAIRRASLRNDGAFREWLLRIARNNLCDAIRGLRQVARPNVSKRVDLSAKDSYMDLLDTLARSSATPSYNAILHEQIALMRTAITQLPQTYRRVVEQLDIECRPATDVAHALDRSVGAVYMIRARAHDRLREILAAAKRA